MRPGEVVGPYRLVEPLGQGGMGEVWLAEDPTGAAGGAPRRVALKLLDPRLVDDPAARARFAREVAAARRVRGTSVAALLDADMGDDPPWLASAYVAGSTLDQHVGRHGPMGHSALRALGQALADALMSIHAAGVVHRDLTPRNVVLGPDGPRVVDFGIAWFADAPPITQVGSWVGTPTWMAPERLAADEVGPAGDVWSWGAVMAFAARGRPAVTGTSPQAATHRAARGELELDGVPDWLAPFVRASMSPDPRARPTAAELEAAMSDPVMSAWTGRRAEPTPARGGPADEVAPSMRPPAGGSETGVGTAAGDTISHPGDEGRTSRQRWARRVRVPLGPPDRPAPERGRAARWGSPLVIVGLAAGVGLAADLLVTILVAAVLLMVAVGLGLARERLPDDTHPVPPTWAFALAVPVALGVGLAGVLGPVGGAAAMLAIVVVFLMLGGDIG